MKILIIYGTTEGQTRKVAEFLKGEIEKSGHTVTLCDTTLVPPTPEGFDGVLIGASMHMERYQTAVMDYIRRHHAELNATRSAFFSVSLTAAANDEVSWKELENITTKFLAASGWKPKLVEYVAGALLFTQYDFFKKFIMRQIAQKGDKTAVGTEDKEYTDWERLKSFAGRFEDMVARGPQVVRKEETDFEAVC